jgi:ectoine hydroxylase-related dioxygenase (phytanoyl-CoA dioxygenase family)
MEKHFIQDFDYAGNPNYSEFSSNNTYFSNQANVEILETVNRIDSLINHLLVKNSYDSAEEFKKKGMDDLEHLRQLLLRSSKSDPELSQTLQTVFEVAIKYTEEFLSCSTQNKEYAFKANLSIVEEKGAQIASLKTDGYLEFNIPHSPEFLRMCDEQMALMRKKYEAESDWRGANSFDRKSAEFKLIEDFIRKEKIIEIISEYKKMNMFLFYAAVDYAHSRQKWFRNNHLYNYLAPTNYYHYDASVEVAKMLIYLSDVKSGDGPFRLVSKSSSMSRSFFLLFIHYANDTEISVKFHKQENLYGRGFFLYRKDLLLKFPHPFIGSTHFGDDLTENSFLSKFLIANTVTFEREKGTAVLFDGFKGIHSGGNAFDGERLAVQVAFKRVPDSAPKKRFSLFNR